MSIPANPIAFPYPAPETHGYNNPNPGDNAEEFAKLIRPRGCKNEVFVATVAREALKLIDRTNGKAYSADELIAMSEAETTSSILDQLKGAAADPTKIGAEFLPAIDDPSDTRDSIMALLEGSTTGIIDATLLPAPAGGAPAAVTPGIVYVQSSNGSDSSAVAGHPELPYATFEAAYAANGESVLYRLGSGNYTLSDHNAGMHTLKIIGQGIGVTTFTFDGEGQPDTIDWFDGTAGASLNIIGRDFTLSVSSSGGMIDGGGERSGGCLNLEGWIGLGGYSSWGGNGGVNGMGSLYAVGIKFLANYYSCGNINCGLCYVINSITCEGTVYSFGANTWLT